MTEPQKKSGCLFGLLANLFQGANGDSRETGSRSSRELDPPQVMVSKYFFSQAEMSFFRVLQQCVGADSTILCQVSMQQLFYFKDRGQKAWQNKIRAKSIDFLLCDTQSLRPVLGIELDDISHEKPERIVRDDEVDRVFAAANLPILHVKAARQYGTDLLLKQIQDKIQSVRNVR